MSRASGCVLAACEAHVQSPHGSSPARLGIQKQSINFSLYTLSSSADLRLKRRRVAYPACPGSLFESEARCEVGPPPAHAAPATLQP